MGVLSERETEVLLAVIDSYVRRAEPAGSRRVARDYEFGVSPATVRNTMADLEEKGYLTHPHPSAGRVPTDLGYRYYVDTLMDPARVTGMQRARIRTELAGEHRPAVEELVRRAARVVGLLTGELGLAVGPTLADAVLEKLDLVRASSEKVLLILTLESGVVRTVYVDLPGRIPDNTLDSVATLLNERLAGYSLEAIGESFRERLRDLPVEEQGARELTNIFVESGPDIFEWALEDHDVHLGSAAILADQPEFASNERLRSLIELTERRDLLASVLGERDRSRGVQVTIGAENATPELSDLTIVTSDYSAGTLHGVVGVIGPTRMPYDRVVAVVECTSSLVSRLGEG